MFETIGPRTTGRWKMLAIALGLGALFPLLVLAQAGGRSDDEPKGKSSGTSKGKASQPGAGKDGKKAAGDSSPAASSDHGSPNSSKDDAKAKAKGDDDDDDDKDDEIDAKKSVNSAGVELFMDPNAESALRNTFPEIKGTQTFNIKPIQEMARGGIPIDRDLIQKFVNAKAVALTYHQNIQAMIAPDKKQSAAAGRAITQSTRELLEILSLSSGNAGFRNVYLEVLRKTIEPLLAGHMLTRTQAMIVLEQTGDPELLELFVKQIENSKQLLVVKLLAARGISRIADYGRRIGVNPQQAVQAAKALSDFLEEEPKAFWFVQFRALEALGSLRYATEPLKGIGKAEMASVSMRYITDPEARLEVRAWACWALGMMRLQSENVNFQLIARAVGQVSLEIGQAMLTDDHARVPVHESLLIEQLLPGFTGSPNVADSGLLYSARSSPSLKTLSDVHKLIREIGLAGDKLAREPTSKVPANRKALDAKIGALRDYLAKIDVKDNRLTPGGPQFNSEEPRPGVANGRPGD